MSKSQIASQFMPAAFAASFARLKRTTLSWELRRAIWLFRETHQRALERQFYRNLIPKDDLGCIVDVGANGGSKTEIFRALASRVVAVEPDPSSAQLLRNRFRLRPGIVVQESAIAERSGMIPFYVFEPGSAFNTADQGWVSSMMDGSNHMHLRLPQPKRIDVKAKTLDELMSEFYPVKYVKIDVEGFEAKVLSTLRHPVLLISMEFNFPQRRDALRACISRLDGIGNYGFNAAITEPPLKLEYNRWLSGNEIVDSIARQKWQYTELYARIQ
jgi:FkbM family methyltransferase